MRYLPFIFPFSSLKTDAPRRTAFIRSQASIPKLSLVVTVTLRDDPQLEIVLERARKGILPGLGGARVGTGEDVLEEDDEYMDEASYDRT